MTRKRFADLQPMGWGQSGALRGSLPIIWVIGGYLFVAAAAWTWSFTRRQEMGWDLGGGTPLQLALQNLGSWVVVAGIALLVPWGKKRHWYVQVLVVLGLTAMLELARHFLLLWISPVVTTPAGNAFYIGLLLAPAHMILIGTFVGAGYAIRLSVEHARRAAELDQLESEVAQSRYHALKTQLSREFLFGSLLSIEDLLRRDVRGARDSIVQFSQVLRTSFRTITADLITLQQEMEFTRRYVDLSASQTGTSRPLVIEADPSLSEVLLPHQTLFALAESLRYRTSSILIRVVPTSSDAYEIIVESQSDGSKPLDGVPLKRLRERLDARLGTSYRMLTSEHGPTLVVLKLPRTYSPAAAAEQFGSARVRTESGPVQLQTTTTPRAFAILKQKPHLLKTLFVVWLSVLLTGMLLLRLPLPLPYQVAHATLNLLGWIFLTWAGLRIADQFPLAPRGRAPVLLIVTAGAALVFAETLVVNIVACRAMAAGCLADPELYNQQARHLLYLGGTISTGYALHLIERNRRQAAARSKKRLAVQTADLNVLSTQLRPHFIFNVLNAVDVRSRSDAAAALGILSQLRELLERSFTVPLTVIVPLREEIETLRLYAQIEQERFPGKFEVIWQINPSTLELGVPHFALQPLVENAVKHGMGMRESGGTIWVTTRLEPERLVLEVRDNGRSFNEKIGPLNTGVGLANLRSRLLAIYGPSASMQLSAEPGLGFSVQLDLPVISEPSRNAEAAVT